MPLWFIITTAIIVIGSVAVCNWVFHRIGQRLVSRLDGWETWTEDERLESLKDLKIETLMSQARTWRIIAIILVLVVYFVPTAMILIGQSADETQALAEKNEHTAQVAASLAEDVAVVLENTEYEACVATNEARLYNQNQRQVELDQAERNLAEVRSQPLLDVATVPGFSEAEPAVQQIVSFFGVLIVQGRDSDIDRLEAEVLRLAADLDTYTTEFPLRQCGDDPIPTTTTSTSTTTTSTSTTSTTSTTTSSSTSTTTMAPQTTAPSAVVGGPAATQPFPPTTARPVGPTAPTTTIAPSTTLDCPGNSNNCNRRRR